MREQLLHYNEQLEKDTNKHETDGEHTEKKKTSCRDYLTRFDQLIMRPILIHKYEKDKEARAQDFYEMF